MDDLNELRDSYKLEKYKVNKKEKKSMLNDCLKKLSETKLNFKTMDVSCAQINIYFDKSIVVYYCNKKSMYYKKDSKEIIKGKAFYDGKYENVEIDECIKFCLKLESE